MITINFSAGFSLASFVVVPDVKPFIMESANYRMHLRHSIRRQELTTKCYSVLNVTELFVTPTSSSSAGSVV
jgi:hypothetical protein